MWSFAYGSPNADCESGVVEIVVERLPGKPFSKQRLLKS